MWLCIMQKFNSIRNVHCRTRDIAVYQKVQFVIYRITSEIVFQLSHCEFYLLHCAWNIRQFKNVKHRGRSIKHISGIHSVTCKGNNSVTCVHKYIFYLIIRSILITIISLTYFYNISCSKYNTLRTLHKQHTYAHAQGSQQN
jgi:hypothetical protein